MNEKFSLAVKDLESTYKMADMLSRMAAYKRIGQEGLFTILMKARSLGMDPLDAVSGSLYYVNGKVELSSYSMNLLIRQAGHSFTKDPKSDDTICILHGKRKDTDDTMTSSFSIDDAKRAHIYRGPWITYPSDMLFARALSRLARQLYPDVIKGCYVEGEIHGNQGSNNDLISREQADELQILFDKADPSFTKTIMDGVRQFNPKAVIVDDIPCKIFKKIKFVLENHLNEQEQCA